MSKRALYLEHLHELAETTGAQLTFYEPDKGSVRKGVRSACAAPTRALGEPEMICTPRPLTRMHYLIGLHEFGHAHYPELGPRGMEGVCGELAARVWAFDHSRVPIRRKDVETAFLELVVGGSKLLKKPAITSMTGLRSSGCSTF